MAKKLLEESTIRRFQKIAGIKNLNESYGKEPEEDLKEEEKPEEEKEKVEEMAMPSVSEEEMDEPAAEMPAEPAAEMPAEPADKPADEEVELDVDEGDMGEDDKVELLQKLAAALGIDVEVEGNEEEGEEMEMEEPATEEGEGKEEPQLEEGEHMEETPVDPAGHSLDKMVPMDGSKNAPKDANMTAMPKGKQQHMAESREDFKKRLVEEVSKRVAARLKTLK